MQWTKGTTIIFDTPLPEMERGQHNGKYQGIEFRLRSDGKMFYLGTHSKVTALGLAVLGKQRIDRWKDFLNEEVDSVSVTNEEFAADVERQRLEFNGAYIDCAGR